MRSIYCFGFALLLCSAAMGQLNERVLYSFGANGGIADGNIPNQGVVFDSMGNLYGTTQYGGINCNVGCGTVFKLSPAENGSWSETVLWTFCKTGSPPNCPDGEYPQAGLTIDSDGNLYGTTTNGGANTCGTVFELSPPFDPGAPWIETVLWSFDYLADGCAPWGKVLIDASGNLYGTTSQGGRGQGTVFELSPVQGGWVETTLYTFHNTQDDGAYPLAGVTFDSSGNPYGTTKYGGHTKTGGCGTDGCGTVFQLSPQPAGNWTESILYRFRVTEENPSSDVSFDDFGNLYGTMEGDGNGFGGVFKFSPGSRKRIFLFNYQNGANPYAGVLVNKKTGTVYGVTWLGGANGNHGTVFRISQSGERVLYSFCSQHNCVDGDAPKGGGSPVFRNNRLYGTTSAGGAFNQGIVFEIVP